MSDPDLHWIAIRADCADNPTFLLVDDNGEVGWTAHAAQAVRFDGYAHALFRINRLAPGLARPCCYVRG